MNILNAALALVIFMSAAAIGQNISQNDIHKFVGCVEVEYEENLTKIAKPKFVKYCIMPEPNRLNIKTFLPGDCNVIVGDKYSFRKANPGLRITNSAKNKTLIVMQDLFGFERCDAILTFWKIQGDSLSFIQFYDKTIPASIGSVSIIGDMSITGNAKAVLLKSEGGDGGDTWGKFYLFQWTMNDSLFPLFEKAYNWSYEDSIQIKPDCQLVKNGATPSLRQITGTFRNELRKTEGSNVMVDVPVQIAADTTYYEISKLSSGKGASAQ